MSEPCVFVGARHGTPDFSQVGRQRHPLSSKYLVSQIEHVVEKYRRLEMSVHFGSLIA